MQMCKLKTYIQQCISNEWILYYIVKYLSKAEPTVLSPGIAQAIQQIQREEIIHLVNSSKYVRGFLKKNVSALCTGYKLWHLFSQVEITGNMRTRREKQQEENNVHWHYEWSSDWRHIGWKYFWRNNEWICRIWQVLDGNSFRHVSNKLASF